MMSELKNSFLVMLLTVIVLFVSCSEQQKSSGTTENLDIKKSHELLGTWKMISYKSGNDSFFVDVPSIMYYKKHITPTHFSWISYDDDGDNIFGAGGGTYEYVDGEYTEIIEYFFPPGSNLQGSKVTFNSKIEGDQWNVSAYVKSISLDPSTGDYVQIDSVWLEEVWERF